MASPQKVEYLSVKYGPERADRLLARGADVVEHEVEEHAEPGAVGGVDQPLQAVGPAVGLVRGPEVDAVVAPAAAAREVGDRHQLDRGDAQLGELGQVRDDRVERAVLRERPDVQLVDDQLLERHAVPAGVVPRPRTGIHDARGPAQPGAAAAACAGPAAARHR